MEGQWLMRSAQTDDVKGAESRMDTSEVLSLHLLGHEATAMAMASPWTTASAVHV